MDNKEEKKPNPKENQKNKKKNNKNSEFEFCKVCKLNHDQGRRHNYFPNHKKSLSSFLSRFLNKLSDVRFFLKNPTFLRPEHASRNRIWCVFCDSDIEELGSLFACSNAIKHLASVEHLKNLKHFLWRYGGGMDRVDSFRVSDSDLAQWERRCGALKSSSSSTSERCYGPSMGNSKDIQNNQISSDSMDRFEKSRNNSISFSNSNGFLPLQNFTNERNQVSYRENSDVANICTPLPGATSLSYHTQSTMESCGMNATGRPTNGLEVQTDPPVSNYSKSSAGWPPANEEVQQVGRLGDLESRNQVLQSLTPISPLLSEEPKANVHSGAPPPWLEKNELNIQVSTGLHTHDKKSGKSQKLNPKRVGAAWAEKRKIELEMEKRGEIVRNSFDANWLPNFGRVWQSGSRKESRKEFEMEKPSPVELDILSDAPMKIQPYISKRMRKDAGGSKDDTNGHFEGLTNNLR